MGWELEEVKPDEFLRAALEDMSVESPLEVGGVRVFPLNWPADRGCGDVYAIFRSGAGLLLTIDDGTSVPSRGSLAVHNRSRFPILIPEGALFVRADQMLVARDSEILEAGDQCTIPVCQLGKNECSQTGKPILFRQILAPQLIRIHLKRLRKGGVILGLCSVWADVVRPSEAAASLFSTEPGRSPGAHSFSPKESQIIQEKLVKRRKVAGLIAATGGHSAGLELFGSHDLFTSHVVPLLGASVLDRSANLLEDREPVIAELRDSTTLLQEIRDGIERPEIKQSRRSMTVFWEARDWTARALLHAGRLVHLSVSVGRESDRHL